MSIFDVTLNDIPMSSLSNKIIIRDIIEEPVEEDVYKSKRAAKEGQRVAKIVRRALSVRVVYVIRERNPVNRATIMDSISNWARNGGTLMVNYRISERTTNDGYTYNVGRQLSRVVLETPPVQDSANKWTQDLSLVFTAYESPYWEDFSLYGRPVTMTYDSLFGRYQYYGTIYCNGTAPRSYVWATLTNISSGTLQSANIRVGEAWFYLENLGIGSGDSLIIEYDENNLLVIKSGRGFNLLSCRTADSNDDLYLVPGSNDVQVSANVQLSGSLNYRERYV